MLEPGKYYKLIIMREAAHGAYLNEEEGIPGDDVLLPRKQIPDGARIGDAVEVFIYRDSEDRIIATVNKPYLVLGECMKLKVAQTTKIGAFMDWGLEKDLFLPFDEQRGKIHEGDELFVGLFLDDSNRLCATMHVYDMLSTESSYKADDKIIGTVHSINDKIGAFVAVDDKFHGLVPNNEIVRKLNYGETISARVSEVRKDGKLVLSLRKKAYDEIDADSAKILDELKKNQGFLPYNDKSNPEIIKRKFTMSKAAFKRAVGRLLKYKKIEILDKGIQMKEEE